MALQSFNTRMKMMTCGHLREWDCSLTANSTVARSHVLMETHNLILSPQWFTEDQQRLGLDLASTNKVKAPM